MCTNLSALTARLVQSPSVPVCGGGGCSGSLAGPHAGPLASEKMFDGVKTDTELHRPVGCMFSSSATQNSARMVRTSV